MVSLQNKKILVVVAHPDDELLGPGATINRLVTKNNCTVKVVILGEGITSRSDKRNTLAWRKELKKHKENILKAKKFIGYQQLSVHDFPDNRFDSVTLLDIIKVIEKEKKDFKPQIIFTHHGGDVNIDHQLCYEAVITACRPLENETVQTIITFETPSSTEWRPYTGSKQFEPDLFVSVTEKQLENKIRAMECYEFEKRKYPHPRSPQALKIQAQRWGVAVGKKFAEAFSIIRHIA